MTDTLPCCPACSGPTAIKDLKIKGSSTVIKVGIKVRGIRLMDGVGPMQLKSSVVKKA